MTLNYPRPNEATERAAQYLAQALNELQQAAAPRADELATRADLEALASRIEAQFREDEGQRLVLATQLTGLATSLDHLVIHLQDLAQLTAGLLSRAAVEPASAAAETPQAASEAAFQPGGEGLSLILGAVPGFQALMDIQKALLALPHVTGVSVERFQEGDSRLLIHLQAAITARELADALRSATGHAAAIDESRPELLSLRLRIVPAA